MAIRSRPGPDDPARITTWQQKLALGLVVLVALVLVVIGAVGRLG